MEYNKRKSIHKGVSPLVKVLNRHLDLVKGNRQGMGKLGLENHMTETIVDTTKMTPAEKAEYIKQFNAGK